MRTKTFQARKYDGYWQSSRYFSRYRNQLIKQIYPKDPVNIYVCRIINELEKNQSVAIHMRKGDFGNGSLKKIGHLLCPDYYIRAIQYCNSKVPNPIYYVFTDDSEWARSIIGGNERIRFISDICKTNAVEDLLLISKACHGIMSASTFSWWGNWIREKKGIVIVPNGSYYNDYFYEDDWIRI